MQKGSRGACVAFPNHSVQRRAAFRFSGLPAVNEMIFESERGYKEILFSYTWVKTNWNVTDVKRKMQTAGS